MLKVADGGGKMAKNLLTLYVNNPLMLGWFMNLKYIHIVNWESLSVASYAK